MIGTCSMTCRSHVSSNDSSFLGLFVRMRIWLRPRSFRICMETTIPGPPGVSLKEGTSVTVLAKDEEGGFDLTPEQGAELLLSIAEADRGETVSAEEVLAKLARRRG